MNTTAKTILIIDDSKIDRAILGKLLSHKIHCKIIEASGSLDAFQILDTIIVDMILLDVEMPNMSGDEIIVEIRKRKSAEELPIIMVSGNATSSMMVKCLQNGANDYIEKPFNFEVAVMRIMNHLKLSEAIRDRVRMNELAAINAMITTYHHEINNPLTIAKMELLKLQKALPHHVDLRALSESLNRITEVVHKIQQVKQEDKISFEPYSGQEKMVKVKK